nr:MAG TPA: hypothetical protein [Caudoviricetes sp.]
MNPAFRQRKSRANECPAFLLLIVKHHVRFHLQVTHK